MANSNFLRHGLAAAALLVSLANAQESMVVDYSEVEERLARVQAALTNSANRASAEARSPANAAKLRPVPNPNVIQILQTSFVPQNKVEIQLHADGARGVGAGHILALMVT